MEIKRRGGAPYGNKNNTRTQPWSDAVRRALFAEDGKKLREIAEKLCNLALEGNMEAIKEIGNRCEGRTKQQIILTDPDGVTVVKPDVMEVARSIGFLLTSATQSAEALARKRAAEQEPPGGSVH